MTLLSLVAIGVQLCFNPHTHEGCDFFITVYFDVTSVSIHTPTKGVTLFGIDHVVDGIVSIHTPTKGVTYGLMW